MITTPPAGSWTAPTPATAAPGGKPARMARAPLGSGTRRAWAARLAPRRRAGAPLDHEPALLLVDRDPRRVRSTVEQVGAAEAEPDELAVPGQQVAVRCAAGLLPAQLRALEGGGVLRVGHVLGGPAEGGELAPAALRARPRPSSGSSWSVKYWNGVDAAPLLALEQHRHERRGEHQRGRRPAAGSGRRSVRRAARPAARLPTWSWFCGVADEAVAGQAADRPAVAAAAVRRVARRRSTHTPARSAVARSAERAEVGVVAVALAGEHGVQGVVEVVAPLRRRARSRRPRGARTSARVVEVALGDQPQRPAELRPRGASTSSASCSRKWRGRRVDDGVHGVEAQPVDVVVAQPHAARCRRRSARTSSLPGAVEVDRLAPRRAVAVGEVRAEARRGSCPPGRGGCRRRRAPRRGRGAWQASTSRLSPSGPP